jgi:hypothetical protein
MNEQIKRADALLMRIFEHVSNGAYKQAYREIEEASPIPEWIIELPSRSQEGEVFKTLKLELMEALMKTIFGYAAIKSISAPIINQDRNGAFAVTVNVIYEYADFDGEMAELPGIATVYSPNIQMLEMATPKASSMAVKNAIKQMGGLFGKYLNRTEIADEVVPEKPKELSKEEQRMSVIEGIMSAKNVSELKAYRYIAYSAKLGSQDAQTLYEDKLRKLSKTTQTA